MIILVVIDAVASRKVDGWGGKTTDLENAGQ
jgi:hypothetical protein